MQSFKHHQPIKSTFVDKNVEKTDNKSWKVCIIVSSIMYLVMVTYLYEKAIHLKLYKYNLVARINQLC